MGLTISDYGSVLKRWYRGPIIETLTKSRILLAHIKREADKSVFKGNEVHTPVHTSRNLGVGVRGENAALPTAGNQGHTVAIYNMAYQYARIRLTGPVMSASKSSTGAFAKALNVEMKGALQDALEDHHRQLWHDGSGRLADCTDNTGPSTTVTTTSTKYIKAGMTVDLKDTSDGTAVSSGTGITVSSVTDDTDFVASASVTTAATDSVYVGGARPTATFGTKTDVWGLEALCAAADIKAAQGLTYEPGRIAIASYPTWAAQTAGGAATATTFDVMQSAWDACDINADGVPRVVLTNHAGRRFYATLFNSNRRYVNTLKLKGGFTGLEFNGTGVFADRDCNLTANPGTCTRMYFLNLSDFCYYVQEEWDWIDEGGSILHWVTGYDAYEAVLRAYLEFAVKERNKQCVMTTNSF